MSKLEIAKFNGMMESCQVGVVANSPEGPDHLNNAL